MKFVKYPSARDVAKIVLQIAVTNPGSKPILAVEMACLEYPILEKVVLLKWPKLIHYQALAAVIAVKISFSSVKIRCHITRVAIMIIVIDVLAGFRRDLIGECFCGVCCFQEEIDVLFHLCGGIQEGYFADSIAPVGRKWPQVLQNRLNWALCAVLHDWLNSELEMGKVRDRSTGDCINTILKGCNRNVPLCRGRCRVKLSVRPNVIKTVDYWIEVEQRIPGETITAIRRRIDANRGRAFGNR